jgi:serine/threonine-protein kinase
LYWQAADGTGVAERLTTEPNRDRTAWSFSPDGKALVFSELSDQSYDFQVLLLESRRTQTMGRTRFFKGSPAISRDGRWIAYRADETGRDEIYVRPFPDWDKKRVQVSTNGGRAPVWSADGRELFFDNGDAMMVVAVQTSGDFAHGTPRLMFEGQYVHGGGGARNYDVAPDGKRFLMIKQVEPNVEPPPRDRLTVVLNWGDEVRQALATAK